MPKKICELDLNGLKLKVYQSTYRNGRAAIFLEESGIPFATLTVNLPNEELKEDEIFIKTWNENEEIAPWMLRSSGLFEDTGKSVISGFVKAPIWRFKKEE